MANQPQQLTPEQKCHWAYRQGYTAGLAGDKSERGWMSFGLSCAATALDAQNTRLWLAGFDDAANEPPKEKKTVEDPWAVTGQY